VTGETARTVLEACPNGDWRLIFALCRYGGLRCPSEVRALRWSDIDWGGSRFTVRSTKTEHHEGKGRRLVPIFPELRPYLEAAFDVASEGAIHVIDRTRDGGVNLRTQLRRIIERAGLTPWPKLFHNLRESPDRASRTPSYPRCLCLAGELDGDCERALLASHRRSLPGRRGQDEREGPGRGGAESGAVSGGKGLSRVDSGTCPRAEKPAIARACNRRHLWSIAPTTPKGTRTPVIPAWFCKASK